MSSLLIFNPEHDYALGSGGKHYSSPASVAALARRLEWLPEIWGNDEDFILKTDGKVTVVSSPLPPVPLRDIADNITAIEPWGWDLVIKNRLLKLEVKEDLIPDDDYIDNVRRLSHRRISILCNKQLNSPSIPTEFSDTDSAIEFANLNPGCYFKLPWSSGGRGVVDTRELNASQIKEWVSGAIRRQGSVIGEKGLNRVLDFASLWNVDQGKVDFEGFSVSLSDGRGKYNGNLFGSQEEILAVIKTCTLDLSPDIIDKQRIFINNDIARFYNGKLGIDMIADSDGVIYPCIEINLRRTMGHVAMDYYNLNNNNPGRILSNQPFPLVPANQGLKILKG